MFRQGSSPGDSHDRAQQRLRMAALTLVKNLSAPLFSIRKKTPVTSEPMAEMNERQGPPMKNTEAPPAEVQPEENWWDYCPICNARLINHKCKYVCSNSRCHFFMSCSEFDL